MYSFNPEFSFLFDVVGILDMGDVCRQLVVAGQYLDKVDYHVLQRFLFNFIYVVLYAINEMDHEHIAVRPHLIIALLLENMTARAMLGNGPYLGPSPDSKLQHVLPQSLYLLPIPPNEPTIIGHIALIVHRLYHLLILFIDFLLHLSLHQRVVNCISDNLALLLHLLLHLLICEYHVVQVGEHLFIVLY